MAAGGLTIENALLAIGLGRELRLEEDERVEVVSQAARLGYTSAWTNAPMGHIDAAFASCRAWHARTGLATGVNVVATPGADLSRIARAAREVGAASAGRFVLGIGTGGLADPRWRAERGLEEARPLTLMRAHLEVLRKEAGVPVYLAAMGPRMLELAGRHADGVLPNFMDPPTVRQARQRVDEAATAADRAKLPITQFVRVCVDADPLAARAALARHVLGYALGRPGEPSAGGVYRAHFSRMGLDDPLDRLEARRDEGASMDQLVEEMPDEVLSRLGAWGTAEQAVTHARALASELDLGIVRVVTAKPGLDGVLAVVEACVPARQTHSSSSVSVGRPDAPANPK